MHNKLVTEIQDAAAKEINYLGLGTEECSMESDRHERRRVGVGVR